MFPQFSWLQSAQSPHFPGAKSPFFRRPSGSSASLSVSLTFDATGKACELMLGCNSSSISDLDDGDREKYV